MKATCIEWVTEGADIVLPDEVELPDEVVYDEDGDIDYDEIDDYLSDFLTGFCHCGYVLEE